ncbi:MAG TPA: hypothetical protein VMW38_19835, partial [Terriglobia bacterium]|nr:hypothetical protein [Terriglobia bacterium]
PQHQESVGGEGVNRRERPPRAAAAAPAADGALGYCLPPPAGLNKEEAASCRFTNVQSPEAGLLRPAPRAMIRARRRATIE